MEKIAHFIEQHKNWRRQILAARDAGRYDELSVILFSIDNQYFLGKWLTDVTDPKLLASPLFQRIKSRHKDFHLLTHRIRSELRNGIYKDAPQCCDQFRAVTDDLIQMLEELGHSELMLAS